MHGQMQVAALRPFLDKLQLCNLLMLGTVDEFPSAHCSAQQFAVVPERRESKLILTICG